MKSSNGSIRRRSNLNQRAGPHRAQAARRGSGARVQDRLRRRSRVIDLVSGPLLRTSSQWQPIFAGIPPDLRVVSKLVKIKCDLILVCKIYLIFAVNYLIFQC